MISRSHFAIYRFSNSTYRFWKYMRKITNNNSTPTRIDRSRMRARRNEINTRYTFNFRNRLKININIYYFTMTLYTTGTDVKHTIVPNVFLLITIYENPMTNWLLFGLTVKKRIFFLNLYKLLYIYIYIVFYHICMR